MRHNPKFSSLIVHLIFAGIAAYISSAIWLIELPYAWIVSINLLLFLSFGLDKFASMKKWRRTPESTYFILALMGAFPGLFLGRKIFNHKTSKTSFIITMWLLFIGQILFSAWWMGDADVIIAKLVEKKQQKECIESGKCQEKPISNTIPQ